jgi:protein SCO1/2
MAPAELSLRSLAVCKVTSMLSALCKNWLLRAVCPALMAMFGLVHSAHSASGLSGMIDDLGQPADRQTLHRPLRLLIFGYTTCPDVCPLTLLAVHQALSQLGPLADDVDPMFVTVDPDRDSQEKLHQYVESFDPRIRAYRGSDHSLEHLAQPLRVRYWREVLYPGSSDYSMSHTATLFLLNRNQQLLIPIEHTDAADSLASAIVRAVRRADHHAAAPAS